MAVYKEHFGIVLEPSYQINEDTSITTDVPDGVAILRVDNQLSLFTEGGEAPLVEPTTKYYGGKFDWRLLHLSQEPPKVKPLVKVQLMRLWTIQMVQQLVSNKSYLNEADSKIKVNISKDDLNTTLRVLDVVTNSIYKEIDVINNSMVSKKKMPPFKLV